MWGSLSRKLSRKRVANTMPTGSYQDLVTLRNQQSMVEGLSHRSKDSVSPLAEGAPKAAYVSAAGYHAFNPQNDQHLLQVDSKHMFAIVLTSKASARGSHYLRQHLHTEVLAQIRQQNGSVPAALRASLDGLNKGFRNLHPFNPDVLEGVRLAVVYIDFAAHRLHIISNGACRCVVGRTLKGGLEVEVVADVGRTEPTEEPKGVFSPAGVATVELTHDVDTIILGSTGFWKEVAPYKALLRLQHYYEHAPRANLGAAAAHLTNYALHCITRRVRASTDLRNRSLRSVGNLQSLQLGEKSQYKWGDRQPVRRRRGDVHGDLTALVLSLDWEGKHNALKEGSTQMRPAEPVSIPPAAKAYSHWDLVRLHFVSFAAASKRHTEQQWRDLVAQAVHQSKSEQDRDAKPAKLEKRASVELLARAGSKEVPVLVEVSAA